MWQGRIAVFFKIFSLSAVSLRHEADPYDLNEVYKRIKNNERLFCAGRVPEMSCGAGAGR